MPSPPSTSPAGLASSPPPAAIAGPWSIWPSPLPAAAAGGRTHRRGRGPPFVANDTDLTGGVPWLVTGPNMGGKSTFLRQNALIAILAQIGSFVARRQRPYRHRRPVFSRVGAPMTSPWPLDLHGRNGRNRRHPQPRHAALAGGSRRSAAHGDLRWPLDRLGRRQSLHDETGCRGLFATISMR